MTACPRCHATINSLKVALTQWHIARLTDDWTEQEKKELNRADKWPSQNGHALGYSKDKTQKAQYEYYCPKCGALLFTAPQQALDFLTEGKTNVDSS